MTSKIIESLPHEITAPTSTTNKIEKLDQIMMMADFDPNLHPVVLIDVRGREEREKDGHIPHSVNVPLGELEEAIHQLSDEDFKIKYNFSKPKKDAYIVLSCWAGMRAQKALDILAAAGFTHCKYSSGSYKQYYTQKRFENLPHEITAPTSTTNKIEKLDHIMMMADFDPNLHPIVLIDVRGREEREKAGFIPHSVNVPLDEFQDAFEKLSEDEFKAKYNFSKPSKKDSYIVITCRSGARAQKALEIISNLGYTHAKYDAGSWKAYHYHQLHKTLPQEITAPSSQVSKIENLEHVMAMAVFDPNEHPVVLLDVRGREERQKDGSIPHSVNVPLDELEDAIKLNQDGFKEKYGFAQPKKDAYIVVACWAGMRAQKALEILSAAGFTHAKYFPGSYKQYCEALEQKQKQQQQNKNDIVEQEAQLAAIHLN